MQAVDVGCGIGTVSRWIAGRVGSEGAVVGVDVSAAQLEVARQEAQRLGLTNFGEGDVPVATAAQERLIADAGRRAAEPTRIAEQN
jgi:2-polyprenyl-3-methyl-5-hydroxy-6-metoxy-1,4-benzoquinol methylase